MPICSTIQRLWVPLLGLLWLSSAWAVPAPAPRFDDLMPAEVIGARSFVAQHPSWDGRGLVVAVLDTGVDPRAPGLQKTTTGAVKVLEARDFSQQGDVVLDLAEVTQTQGGTRLRQGSLELRDVDRLPFQPVDGQWWLGHFSETQIGPESLRDLNHDGKTTSELALLVWRDGPGPDDVKALLDLNGDGSAVGDPVIGPYHVAQELFVPAARQANQDVAMLSLAFEPDLAHQTAQLHFTDGSHGTHVAGIIAGYGVFGHAGWDGIAPGAQILSLKIGHNGRSGGATTPESFKKALEFAARYSRVHGQPVVVNASYGIGSASEGQSDIDHLVDKLVQENPLLTVTFSAGNAGPGLSSIGTPAAADLAIAAGALLPKDAAATLYTGKPIQDEVFPFSSRGGELNKPELVAPGVATTSVPVWDGREMKNGTSMASPQIAGVFALLWSAVLAQEPGHKPGGWHSGLLRRALIWSAKPLPSLGLLDQGHGVPDVSRALALAHRLASSAEAQATLGYHLESSAPRPDGARTPATYLRGFVPDGQYVLHTQVHALLPGYWTAEERERFSGIFDIKVEGDWLEVLRPRLVLRGEKPGSFEVRVKPEKLKAPGLYVARVLGRAPGASSDETAFESWQVVIVPERFDGAGPQERHWNDVTLPPGRTWRQFVLVPPGAKHVRVTASRVGAQFADAGLAIFDPDGERLGRTKKPISSQSGQDAQWMAAGEELKPGVWEIDLFGQVSAQLASHVDLEVSFTSLHIDGVAKLRANSGGLAKGSVTLTNWYDRPLLGSARATISEAVHSDEHHFSSDNGVFKMTLGPQFQGARLQLSLDKAFYQRCTDVAVVVKDSSGHEVASGGFASPSMEIDWRKPAAAEATYSIEVWPAWTHRLPQAQGSEPRWTLQVEQHLQLTKPIGLDVQSRDGAQVNAFPLVPLELTIKAQEALPMAPDKFHWAGEVDIRSRDGAVRWLVLPVESF